jgi:hypothetical protein
LLAMGSKGRVLGRVLKKRKEARGGIESNGK